MSFTKRVVVSNTIQHDEMEIKNIYKHFNEILISINLFLLNKAITAV